MTAPTLTHQPPETHAPICRRRVYTLAELAAKAAAFKQAEIEFLAVWDSPEETRAQRWLRMHRPDPTGRCAFCLARSEPCRDCHISALAIQAVALTAAKEVQVWAAQVRQAEAKAATA